jgi:hypothetical protein
MSQFLKLKFIIILLTIDILLINARSFSVNTSACFSMIPEHDDIEAQSSIELVQIIPHKIKIYQGQEMKVSLLRTTNNFTFRGFMMQSRDTYTNNIVGNFIVKDYNVMSCGYGSNTATHKDPTEKEGLTLIWRAPKQFSGFVRFQ